MKFDVIIGNPPYQKRDGGAAASAIPLYNLFIEQAIKLSPRYISMIVPARWYSGGRGLDEFRDEMLSDNRIRIIHDYWKANDCFPTVELKGGVCYFLWDKDNRGDCLINMHNNGKVSVAYRPLLEDGADTFIRHNEAIPILRKTRRLNEECFIKLISTSDPFGFNLKERNNSKKERPVFRNYSDVGCVKVYHHRGLGRCGYSYVNIDTVPKNIEWLSQHKVFISKAYAAGDIYPHQIINKPIYGEPNSCCIETYLLIGPFDKKETADNVISYMNTKFFRFLVLLIKNTQQAARKVYSFVPVQDFSESWTDEKLYKKYGLTDDEISLIESMIRPMK